MQVLLQTQLLMLFSCLFQSYTEDCCSILDKEIFVECKSGKLFCYLCRRCTMLQILLMLWLPLHLLNSSLSHLLTTSPPHLLTSSPHHLFTFLLFSIWPFTSVSISTLLNHLSSHAYLSKTSFGFYKVINPPFPTPSPHFQLHHISTLHMYLLFSTLTFTTIDTSTLQVLLYHSYSAHSPSRLHNTCCNIRSPGIAQSLLFNILSFTTLVTTSTLLVW